jgi:hypothetical protein
MKTPYLQLLIVILTIASNDVFAQRFKPGLIFGAVSTDLVGVDPYDNDFHKASVTVGGLLSTKISANNSVQFEILYTQKGSLQPADSVNNYTYYKLSLNYIEVPLMLRHNLKININKKPTDRFYFEVGPSFGRLVSIKQNINGSIYNDQSNFLKNEFAINVGLGCEIVNNLYFNIRFSNSIVSVVEHSSQIKTFNNFFWYTFNMGDNQVFAFTLRYIFDKDKKHNATQS